MKARRGPGKGVAGGPTKAASPPGRATDPQLPSPENPPPIVNRFVPEEANWHLTVLGGTAGGGNRRREADDGSPYGNGRPGSCQRIWWGGNQSAVGGFGETARPPGKCRRRREAGLGSRIARPAGSLTAARFLLFFVFLLNFSREGPKNPTTRAANMSGSLRKKRYSCCVQSKIQYRYS